MTERSPEPSGTPGSPQALGGISACVLMVASVIAYVDPAGLPPAHGLYATLAGMLGYAAFARRGAGDRGAGGGRGHRLSVRARRDRGISARSLRDAPAVEPRQDLR